MFNSKYDPSGMLKKIKGFPEQILEYWKKGQSIQTDGFSKPSQLVITGMGGSAISGDLLKDLLFSDLDIPIIVNRGYNLPRFVNEKSLLFISSYSGNTEETINALKEGLRKKAMIVVFTSNGEIGKIAEEKGLPVIKFPKGYPPRSALGFSFFSMLGFVKNHINIPIEERDINNLSQKLSGLRDKLIKPPNEITGLSESLINKMPFIYISRRLKSVALRWQTQINENSKTFAHINVIPELNHNEIVGLEFPHNLIKQVYLILLRCERYENEQIKKRFKVTETLLKEVVGNIQTIRAEGENNIEDIFSLLYKGDFLSYYLALQQKVDPTPVKRIDILKRRLRE